MWQSCNLNPNTTPSRPPQLTARLGPLSAGVRHARNRKPGPAARLPSLSSLLFASVAALCAALYAAPSWSHLGLGVAWSVWPVETVKFIKRHAGEIQPNIYHTNDFGGYMVYHLQEYKVISRLHGAPR